MAIKFFFLPVVQNITQLISDLKYGGATTEEINLLTQQIVSATPLTLPVNPEILEVTTESDVMTTNVVKLGEVVIPTGSKLSRLQIESFFPYKEDSTVIDTLNRISTAVDELLPGYVTAGLNLFSSFTPEKYYKYFKQLQKVGAPVRLIISDCGVDMDVIVESIEKRYITCDKDLRYTLSLIEWRDTRPSGVIKKIVNGAASVVLGSSNNKVAAPTPPRTKTGFAAGDTVIANGRYYYDSFGSSPYGTFKDFRGKISHIASNQKAQYKYHITTLDGGWRGWVKSDQLRGAD